nr:unnamed protein product [Spirometra erinaceieuropaei]
MPGSAVLLVIWLSYATSGLSSRFSRFDVTFAVSNSSSKWSTSVFNLSATESVFGDPSQKETPVNYSPTILGSLFRVHGELRRKLGSKCPNTLGASSKCAFACYIQSLNPIITSLGPKIALVVEEKKNSSCTLLSLLDFSLHFTNASAVLVLHGGKATPNLTGLFLSTLAPNPMACPGYYRACVHSHLPVNDFACGVRPVATNNMVVAVSSRNTLREEKMALPSGDRLPSYDQVTESGLRLVKAPSIEGSTTSGSDEIRPLSPPTPDLPGKRAMQLPLSSSRACEVSNPCAAFIPTSAGVSTTSCSVLPMIVKVDVLDQPPLPPPPPPPPPSLHCVSSPDLRPRPEAADALQLRFLRPGCVHQSSSVIPSVHDNSLPRDLPPPAYSEIVASPDVKFAPNPNSAPPCDRSGGGDHGAILRDPVTSKPLKKAVRFFAHTLASMGFSSSSAAAVAAAAEQKSCSNVPYCVQTHQPPPMEPTSQRYAFPSSPPMCKSCAALGYQRHPRHPYYYVAQSTKSEAAPASAGVSRYHRHHFRNKRGGGAGAVRRSWRDSRASSHRIAKTIELDPTGVIKGFPKSSSSSGSMSSASSQQQWKQAQQTHPSSILVNSGPVRAHFRNVKVTVEPQSQNQRKCEPLALETRGGRILRTYSLPNCLLQSPHSPDLVTFDIVASEHTKHSPNRASVPNLHN